MKTEEVSVQQCTQYCIQLVSFWCFLLVSIKTSQSGNFRVTFATTIQSFEIIILGAFLPWRLAIFIPVIISIPTFIFILFLQESPEWLKQKGLLEEYQRSMTFYKKEEAKNSISSKVEDEKQKSMLNNLRLISKSFMAQDKAFWSTFLLLCTLFACVGWCGFSILSFYATEIFTKSGSPFSASHTSWITSLTKIICSIGSFYVLHKFNRYHDS